MTRTGPFAMSALGLPLEPGADDVCVLEAGAHTTWTVHEAVRTVFQITLPPGEDA